MSFTDALKNKQTKNLNSAGIEPVALSTRGKIYIPKPPFTFKDSFTMLLKMALLHQPPKELGLLGWDHMLCLVTSFWGGYPYTQA